MVKPSIDQLTNNEFNRYVLVIATAKSARHITDSQNLAKISEQNADKAKLEIEKAGAKEEYPDEKPVKLAINKLYCGDFKITEDTLYRANTVGQKSEQ